MKLPELINTLTATLVAEGDVNVFTAGMTPVNTDCLEVTETCTENPRERLQYGDKYLMVCGW